jgi:hypothetical protein
MGKARVSGFYPVFESIAKEFGPTTAVVFGVIWRYCQFESGMCTASQSTMSGKIDISERTFAKHADTLVESGYLNKISRFGETDVYRDTGKVSISIVAEEAGKNFGGQEEDLGKNFGGGSEKTSEGGPKKLPSNIVINRDINRDTHTLSPAEAIEVILNGYPEYVRPVLRPFMSSTGIYPLKKDKAFWIKSAITILEIIGDYNADDIINQAIKDSEGITLSGPHSIINMVRPIVGKKRAGSNKSSEGPWKTR